MSLYEDSNGLKVEVTAPGHEYVAVLDDRIDRVHFQNGPVPANGVNGLTNEALLAILIDRTKFLDEAYPCDQNKNALSHMTAALNWFEERTKNRQARGVEGQNVA